MPQLYLPRPGPRARRWVDSLTSEETTVGNSPRELSMGMRQRSVPNPSREGQIANICGLSRFRALTSPCAGWCFPAYNAATPCEEPR